MKEKYFGITQNENGNYDIEIQKINGNNTFIYSNADFNTTIEIQYLLTELGYTERIKHK